MTGDIRITVPGDMDLPVQLAGMFSIPDIARIAIPPVLGFILLSPINSTPKLAGLIIAAAAGVTAALYKPHETALDAHARNAVKLLTTASTTDSPVETMKDDHIKNNDHVLAVLEVTTTNLSLKTQRQQNAIHAAYTDLFNMLDFPVDIRSEQHRIDLTPYIDRLRERVPDQLDTLRLPYLRFLGTLNNADITATNHYLTVSAGDPTELDRRVARVLSTIRGELSATRLTGMSLAQYAAKHNYEGAHTIHDTHASPAESVGMYNYQKTLIITEQPTQTRLAWPVDLLNVNGLVDITQHVAPANHRDTANTLSRRIEKLQAEIITAQQAGRAGTNRYEARIRDADWMLDKLADNQERPVTQQIAVTVHDHTREAAEQTLEHVKTRLDTLQVKYREPVLQQQAAFKTGNPLHYNPQTFKQLLMPASSAAAAFPFATTDAVQHHGVLYGTEAIEGTPIILNRFDWSAGHTVIAGKTGSGKTFFESLEIIRSLLTYPDLQVYILDPKQDYGDFVEALGGRKVDASPDAVIPPHDRLVSFTVPDRGNPDNPAHLTAVLQKLYRAISTSNRPTLLVIDEAHNLLETADGCNALTQLVREARDTNTAVTLLSQSVNDFASSRQGRVILDNTTGKVLFYHETVPDNVIDQFQLSASEVSELQNLEQGKDKPYSEGLFRISGTVNAKIKVKANMAEFRLLTDTQGGNRE